MKSNPIYNLLVEIFRKILKNSKRDFFIIIFVIVFSSCTVVFTPLLFSKIIDSLNINELKSNSFSLFALYSFLLGLALFLQNSISYLAAILSEKVKFIASTSFFEKVLNKKQDFFINHNSAEIQSAQINGADAFNSLTQLFVMIFIPCILQLILSLYLIGSNIDIIMVFIVFLYGSFFIIFTYFSNIFIRKYLSKAVQQGQINSSLVGNAILNIDNLKFFNSTKWIQNKFNYGANEVFNNWKTYCLIRILYSSVYGIALFVQFIIFFFIILPKYELGLISIGNIVLFNTLLLQLNKPFEMVGLSIETFIRSFAELKPFSEMWHRPSLEINLLREKNSYNHSKDNCIEFKDVSYIYPNGRGIKNISFKTEQNKLNFIVGPSGSGKSTIFKIILKTIEPQCGLATVGQVDLTTIIESELYDFLSIVPQDIIMLNDSLKNNIVLGRDFDEQKFQDSIKLSSLHNLVQSMAEGIETNLGERGLNLSGGERQRIAFARALYNNPKILLLDEASSSLDVKTEEEIIENIRIYCKDITVLAITHRTDIIQSNDHVINLSDINE
ncbi:ATP-binding cassette domain-containing protein [Acinetobacter soli]|nr:ABC transporter ATP-binding protein [Acinetobacter soli]